jgi:cell fate (sporulation/competence/biofilm development) regulator YlbF (YheA/YmcA/DUF963 family)
MNWPFIFDALKTFSGVSIVGFLGYGMTLLKQQNELLAKIGHLESLQAPGLARDLEQMIRTADRLAEEKRQLEEKVKALEAGATFEEVKDIMSKAYLLGVAEASFDAAAETEKATGKLWQWPGLPPYKGNQSPLEALLIRMGEEALEGKPPEPPTLHIFRRLGSRPEWFKIQNPPTELKKTPTKQAGTPSDPEPDPDF